MCALYLFSPCLQQYSQKQVSEKMVRGPYNTFELCAAESLNLARNHACACSLSEGQLKGYYFEAVKSVPVRLSSVLP